MSRYSYKYETFSTASDKFDEDFTAYLNKRSGDHWRVMDCSYCHGAADGKSYASCMFERKS